MNRPNYSLLATLAAVLAFTFYCPQAKASLYTLTPGGDGSYTVAATLPAAGQGAGVTLGGTGTVSLTANCAITLTGLDSTNVATLAPGPTNGIGVMTIQGDVFMANYSRLVIYANPQLGTDQLNVQGGFFINASTNALLYNTITNTALYIVGNPGVSQTANTLVRYIGSRQGTFGQVYYNGVQVANPTNGGIGHYKLTYGALNNDAITLTLVPGLQGTLFIAH